MKFGTNAERPAEHRIVSAYLKQSGEIPRNPANPYNPISLPRISFMSGEHGTSGHTGSSEGTDSLQMSLFEGERHDQS
jgi:hypothetical protein